MEGVHHTGRKAYFADYATKVRERTSVPLMLTGGLRTRQRMNSLVHGGAVDAIGIARPMAFVPDYPARILANEHEPELPQGIRPLGYRPLDGYLQLAIHNAQFHRLATMSVAMTSQVVLPR